MKNIYRQADGTAPVQFEGEAEGFDRCLEMVKDRGFYLSQRPWTCDANVMLERIRDLWPKTGGAWICIIE